MSSGIFNQFTGYHNRRSVRMRGYDYSRSGYYFVTICIYDRTQKLFGDIVGPKSVRVCSVVAGSKPAPTGTVGTDNAPQRNALPEIVRQFKTFSAKRINTIRKSPGNPVWQRNYYEHIIRDEKSLFFIRKYIRENPLTWSIDSENHVSREIQEFAMTEIGAETSVKICPLR